MSTLHSSELLKATCVVYKVSLGQHQYLTLQRTAVVLTVEDDFY